MYQSRIYLHPDGLYTAAMRAIIATAMLILGCCCGIAHATPTPPAPSSSEAAQQTFTGTRAELLDHLKRIAPSCPPQIHLQVSDGLNESFCEQVCNTLNAQQAGAWCHHYRSLGDELTIDIRYTDYCLMLAVHEGRLPATRLSTAQAKAYEKIRRVLAAAQASHRNDYELALALHDYLIINNEYREQVSNDGHVCSLMLHGGGLCECYAGGYYLMARMAGLPCLYVEGSTKGTGHVWNLVQLNGQWVHVDCTYDDPLPDRKGKAQRHYFGMDDATISASHQWKRDAYPACTDGSLWYPRKHSPRFATVDAMAAALIAQARQAGDSRSLLGYVDEVARRPEHAPALLRRAVNRHRRSMSLEQDKNSVMAGFITLTLSDEKRGEPRSRTPHLAPQKRNTP